MTIEELQTELSERITDKQEQLDMILNKRTKEYHIVEGEIIAYLNVVELLEEVVI